MIAYEIVNLMGRFQIPLVALRKRYIMNKVFVYGTLKRDRGNWDKFLQDSQFIEKCETLNKWGFVDLGPFPAMIEDSDSPVIVHGELYEVDNDALELLDFLEGIPHLYTRKNIVIKTKSLGEVIANVYFLVQHCGDDANLVSIESGEW